ncbi:2-hydroxyacyl-CoA dehydratase [Ruminococcaceae bacterium OttesenSCG-928-O06]|nr:2-hydroxyacyl-CoA dehydratase [Ruminococcaceae bacterium OttesenSCG-928-O06]
MKKTHTILFPQMAPIHFDMISAAMRQEGYQTQILENGGPEVAQEGLKYVHNDTCYPALLVIGQFIDALKSGKYDLDHTALLITQTGGGCRASNYIHLLRKALRKAGFPQVPVLSLNFSGLEKDSSLKFTIPLIRKAVAAVFYGDELMCLANQVRPYEDETGSADALIQKWQAEIGRQFAAGKGVSRGNMRRNFAAIAADYAAVPKTMVPRVKVGIVGEIYVKYSPLGNSGLEEFLAAEGCEVNMPGLAGFVQYCIVNGTVDRQLYGGSRVVGRVYRAVMDYTTGIEKMMIEAIERHENLRAPGLFEHTVHLHEGFVGLGAKMGEGWLLTSEMVELVQSGFPNIVCAQPFGCLPNHVVGKGMIAKIRAVYPEANITPIDYDPSATRVNQENRIKLMIAVAKERLEGEAAPLPVKKAEEKAPAAVAQKVAM